MSWSYNSIGRAPAVIEDARKKLGAIKCSEPEETIKGKVVNIIEAALLAMPEASAVKIEAYGSQSAYGNDGVNAGRMSNSVMLKIEPLYGFVE